MASSSGRQPNIAALNRGRHLCLAGRPSGWALAHILVDTVEFLWHDVKVGFAFDKLHLVVAPRSDDTVTRKEDLLVTFALFDFLISTNRQL